MQTNSFSKNDRGIEIIDLYGDEDIIVSKPNNIIIEKLQEIPLEEDLQLIEIEYEKK